jgi:hypothetical protein
MIAQLDHEAHALVWNHGVLSVENLGGMLGPTSFILQDGRQIAPFQIAPWANEPLSAEVPGVLRRLRGEWPCVPYGSDIDRSAKDGWRASQASGAVDIDPHGFGSNHLWRFEEVSSNSISVAIDYPAAHPIRRLERRVCFVSDRAAIDFELGIEARHDCRIPIGLHPCFRLPTMPGAMQIELPPSASSMSYPSAFDQSSLIAPGQFAPQWNLVRGVDGNVFDVSRVPFAQSTEDLLQVLGVPGQASLWNAEEGYRVRVQWNPEHFPSVMLWYSNRGWKMTPWNGRHLALGLEPICSAFELGQQISAAENPISARGVATARSFRAGERFVTRYRIGVEPAERA